MPKPIAIFLVLGSGLEASAEWHGENDMFQKWLHEISEGWNHGNNDMFQKWLHESSWGWNHGNNDMFQKWLHEISGGWNFMSPAAKDVRAEKEELERRLQKLKEKERELQIEKENSRQLSQKLKKVKDEKKQWERKINEEVRAASQKSKRSARALDKAKTELAEKAQELQTEKENARALLQELRKVRAEKERETQECSEEMDESNRLAHKFENMKTSTNQLEQEIQRADIMVHELETQLEQKDQQLQAHKLENMNTSTRQLEQELQRAGIMVQELKKQLDQKDQELQTANRDCKLKLQHEQVPFKQIEHELKHQNTNTDQVGENDTAAGKICGLLESEQHACQELAEAFRTYKDKKEGPTSLQCLPHEQHIAGSLFAACPFSYYAALLGALLAVVALSYRRTYTELISRLRQVGHLQHELDCEGADVMKDGHSHGLGTDFPFKIVDDIVEQGRNRTIEIQCPGISHTDVKVEIIFNGCIVTIDREASPGVEAIKWSQRFQFRCSDGLFEFKEDQASLECGLLTLVLKEQVFQNRVFSFPIHFDLSAADVEENWSFSQEFPVVGLGTESSVRVAAEFPVVDLGAETSVPVAAAQRYSEMIFVAEGLSANLMLPLGEAETSGAPVDTKDDEVVTANITLADMVDSASSQDTSEEFEKVLPEDLDILEGMTY